MPIPSLQLQKKSSLTQRSRGFGHGVVAYKICYVQYSDCVRDLDCRFLIVLSGVTCDCGKVTNSCRNWAFSIPGLQARRPAFQLPMFAKCDALPKGDVVHVCLRNPFPPFFLGIKSIHSLLVPEAWASWERNAPPALQYGRIMPMPSLQLQKKTSLMQRSRGFGHGVVACKICFDIPYTDCAPVWLPQTKLLASVGWKWGCQPFSFRCSQNVTHCRKEICSTCLFKESFPTIPLGIPSIHSLPEAWVSSWEPQHAPPALLKSRLHHAHPFVAASEKSTCLMQRSRGSDHGAVDSKICYNTVIVLSVVLCDCCKPTNSCPDWDFSNSGLEVWLPAFQLPMFAKCDALPKGDLLDMFVSDIHSCRSFLELKASTPYSYQKLELPESGTLHQPCSMVVSCPCLPCSCRKNTVSCREAEGLATELSRARFVSIYRILIVLLYDCQTKLLASVGWKWGCQPFSFRCSQNVTHCWKEICSTCLFKESIPTIPCVNSKHPIPTRSLSFFLRAAACSTGSALWLHYAQASVVTAGKTSPMQRSRGFGHGVVVSKICYNTVIVLSVVLCDCCKPTNNCRDWAFSNSELEVGLPAFQLPMFAKCAAPPKRDLFHMFV